MSNPVDDIPEEELGVERDLAFEQHNRVSSAAVFCQMTFATLDGYADGELADAPTQHMREAQEHLSEAADLLWSEAEVIESRMEAIEARLEELHDD